MIDNPIMELTCVRHPSKKDGKLRLNWKTGLRVPIKQQGNDYVVGGIDSIKETHRRMMRLVPVLTMFDEFLQSEPVIEGTIASILIAPDDMADDGGRGLSRILQALKDSYRSLYPGNAIR